MGVEKTLLVIKPDGVRNRIIGKILSEFEKEFKIIAIKMLRFSLDLANKFYKVHADKPFFQELVGFITSGEVVAFVLEGEDCIRKARQIIGSTDPKIAEPGTIRRTFGKSITENVIHASDSKEFADYEINLLFPELHRNLNTKKHL
jgi:nucleoside-diphosphate kinase